MQRAYQRAVILLLWALPASATPPSIDSFGATTLHVINNSGQSTIPIGITTNQSPDLAVLDYYAPALSSPPQISTIDGCTSTGVGCTGPLTWTRRYQYQTSQLTCGNLVNVTCQDDMERWTAVAAGPVSHTLSVVLNQPIVSAQVDTYGVFALFNVNRPYDPAFTGGPLEAQNTNSAFGTTTNIGATVTTINHDDLVIGAASSPFWISGDGFVECDHGLMTAFTVVAANDSTSASADPKFARLAVEAKQFSLPITATAYGFINQANPVPPTCVGNYAPFIVTLDVMTGTNNSPVSASVLQFQTPW